MTHMHPPIGIFLLPRTNDAEAIGSHQKAVFDYFGDMFDEIDHALRGALPKVKNTFALHEGPMDLAVHAPWTRYLVRLQLSKKSEDLIDENEVEFNMVRVSNCGLCVRTAYGDVRILKSPGEGLPKALTDARVRFVTNNQLAFAFAVESVSHLESLNLFALWRMDGEHRYLGMDIACPKETRDKGDIACYWIAPWTKRTDVAVITRQTPVAPDLDEIVAVPAQDIKIVGN